MSTLATTSLILHRLEVVLRLSVGKNSIAKTIKTKPFSIAKHILKKNKTNWVSLCAGLPGEGTFMAHPTVGHKQRFKCLSCNRKNAQGLCKRTQHCWPTTRNTVGPNLLCSLVLKKVAQNAQSWSKVAKHNLDMPSCLGSFSRNEGDITKRKHANELCRNCNKSGGEGSYTVY